MATFLEAHSKELTLITLTVLLLLTLMVIVPQLLRSHLQKSAMVHEERMRALERDIPLPTADDRSRFAARLALLVPMVVMIAAGTVTASLAIYSNEHIFPVSLAVWVVAGVVSLAAITGGVALGGRYDDIQPDDVDDDPSRYPPP